MATNLRFQVRRGTADAWEAANSVLLAGEVALDTTHRKLKVGDGTTAWKDLPFVTPEVVNNLGSSSTTDALSANQGRSLYNMIPNIYRDASDGKHLKEEDAGYYVVSAKGIAELADSIPTVTNELESTNSTKDALSAKQGWVLNSKIPLIENSLTSDSTTAALSAKQGKELKALIDAKPSGSSVKVINELDSTSTTDALSANMGKFLFDNKINSNLMYNSWFFNGLTDASLKSMPLSAYVGKYMMTKIEEALAGGGGESVVYPTINATVKTGEPGSQASVTTSNEGTTTTFEFTIPRGNTGATGATGARGATGATGAQGPQGPKGADAVVLNSGDSSSTTSAVSAYQVKLINDKLAKYSTETWTFTLSNGTTTTKKVVLSS